MRDAMNFIDEFLSLDSTTDVVLQYWTTVSSSKKFTKLHEHL